MKKIKYLVMLSILLFCGACDVNVGGNNNPTIQPEPTPAPTIPEVTLPVPTEPADVITEEKVYDELPDSIEGVDVTDLSALKNAFDSVENNYSTETFVYFNELAVSWSE